MLHRTASQKAVELRWVVCRLAQWQSQDCFTEGCGATVSCVQTGTVTVIIDVTSKGRLALIFCLIVRFGCSSSTEYVRVQFGTEYVRVPLGIEYVRIQFGIEYVRVQFSTEHVRVQFGTEYVRVQFGTDYVRVESCAKYVRIHFSTEYVRLQSSTECPEYVRV